MAALPVQCSWNLLAVKNKHHQDGCSVWRHKNTASFLHKKRLTLVQFRLKIKRVLISIFFFFFFSYFILKLDMYSPILGQFF